MGKQEKIRLAKSIVDGKEAEALRRVILKDGYLGMGREVQLFEQELAAFMGGKGEVACVSSGTAALQLAVMAAVPKGHEVLVPSLTFVASFQAIVTAGAVPVACEIDPETLLLDLTDAQKKLTAKTKAIMPVHYSGGVGRLEEVYAFAKRHGLRVIEDAAHAFGTIYKGKKIGSFGDIICFSFDGIKNITSGEGGAVVSTDKATMRFVKDARLLGIHKDTEQRFKGQRSWEFEVTHEGFRYHMSNLFAAIGRVQLGRFEKFRLRRQQLAKRYKQGLKDVEGLVLIERDFDTVVPHIFPVLVQSGKRDALREHLRQQGIETGIHYYPNHRLQFFRRKEACFPVTDKVYEQLLSLPLHPGLSYSDQAGIITAIKRFSI